jgi:hypothetical protein
MCWNSINLVCAQKVRIALKEKGQEAKEYLGDTRVDAIGRAVEDRSGHSGSFWSEHNGVHRVHRGTGRISYVALYPSQPVSRSSLTGRDAIDESRFERESMVPARGGLGG